MRAVLRRSALPSRPHQLVVGDLLLDTTQALIQSPLGTVRLTRLEFRLLHYLLINRGQVVATDTILTYVWGYTDSNDRALLKQLVYRLRQKLEPLGSLATLVRAVPSVGYTIAFDPPG